jgi:CspA family cold shock protein
LSGYNEEGQEVMKGWIKWFDTKRGFGFIATDEEQEYFVHHSDLVDPHFTPSNGDEVEFEPVNSSKGLMAVDVEKVI